MGRKRTAIVTVDGRDYCKLGHELTPDNTVTIRVSPHTVTIEGVTERRHRYQYAYCKTCWNARDRSRRHAKPKPARAPRPQPTHCKRGHPYDEANTKTDRHGWRSCRTCDRTRRREAYRRKAEAQRQPRTSRQW